MSDQGVASATMNTTQQIGGAISTALLNSLVNAAAVTYAAAQPSDPLVQADAALHSYDTAFWWSAGLRRRRDRQGAALPPQGRRRCRARRLDDHVRSAARSEHHLTTAGASQHAAPAAVADQLHGTFGVRWTAMARGAINGMSIRTGHSLLNGRPHGPHMNGGHGVGRR
jgi:hypothetical protein